MAGRGQHTVRVHLHHDHRNCLVADPDDPGASLSLSSLLIGRGSLWGGGLSLTCLLRLARRLGGWSLSLCAGSHRSTQVHLEDANTVSLPLLKGSHQDISAELCLHSFTCTGMWW